MKTKLALFVLSKRRHHRLETLVELAGTAFGVHIALFARVNRMRCRRSIQRKQRIFFAVGPNHGFAVCFGAGADQPAFVRAAVEKQDCTVVVGVDIRFHKCLESVL